LNRDCALVGRLALERRILVGGHGPDLAQGGVGGLPGVPEAGVGADGSKAIRSVIENRNGRRPKASAAKSSYGSIGLTGNQPLCLDYTD
jgi:hypothetical protein